MNERIEQCLYLAGLTAQGCWDNLDDYTKQGIEKFAELLIKECGKIADESRQQGAFPSVLMREHFGVK